MPHMETLTVRQARALIGISQVVLADMMGVSPRSIKHWEAGTARPTTSAKTLLGILVRLHETGQLTEILERVPGVHSQP